jgi:membrane associated rhomboid family serine protease
VQTIDPQNAKSFLMRQMFRWPDGMRFTPLPGTLSLLIITVLVFIGQNAAGIQKWRQAAGVIPANFKGLASLFSVGEGQVIPVWLTLFTYIFLHVAWIHLLNNLVAIWLLGNMAEIRWGTRRFVIAYLAFGAVGGLFGVLMYPGTVEALAGASLAFCALGGAIMAYRREYNRQRVRFLKVILVVEWISLLFVILWFVPGRKHSDQGNSLVLHFLPFMSGWFTVRISNVMMRIKASQQLRKTDGTGN